MTCPHCGAAAKDTEKFCPKCSRLVNSPLLAMRQQLDELRASTTQRRPDVRPPSGVPGALPTFATPPAAKPPKPPRQQQKAAARARELTSGRVPAGSPPPFPAPPSALPPAAQAPTRKGFAEYAKRAGLAEPPRPKARREDHSAHDLTAPNPPQPRSSAEIPTAARPGTPPSLVVLVLLNLAVVALLFWAVTTLEGMAPGTLGHNMAEAVRVGSYVLGGLLLLAAVGLWAVQPFGRALQRLVSVLWLPLFPFGTLLGFVSLIYLNRPGVRLLFSGRGAPSLSADEAKALTGTRRVAPAMAMLFLVLGGVSLMSAIGVAANSASVLNTTATFGEWVESLGGTWPTEPATVEGGDVLTELQVYAAAQESYAVLNGGYFDRTECLVQPGCIPGSPAGAGTLHERFLEITRGGYEFRLLMGPTPLRTPGVSPTSVTAFAYVALPLPESSDSSGYCIDANRRPCQFAPSDEVPVVDGWCTGTCVPVEGR